jgi:hypothetical protein
MCWLSNISVNARLLSALTGASSAGGCGPAPRWRDAGQARASARPQPRGASARAACACAPRPELAPPGFWAAHLAGTPWLLCTRAGTARRVTCEARSAHGAPARRQPGAAPRFLAGLHAADVARHVAQRTARSQGHAARHSRALHPQQAAALQRGGQLPARPAAPAAQNLTPVRARAPGLRTPAAAPASAALLAAAADGCRGRHARRYVVRAGAAAAPAARARLCSHACVRAGTRPVAPRAPCARARVAPARRAPARRCATRVSHAERARTPPHAR